MKSKAQALPAWTGSALSREPSRMTRPMPLGDEPKEAVTMKLQVAFTDWSGKVASDMLL